MTPAKVYANKVLFDIFTSVVTRAEGHITSADVKEAIRIRKRGINVRNVADLLNMDDATLKGVLDTVYLAEAVAKETTKVPKLYDI